jgi:hypothetical protein
MNLRLAANIDWLLKCAEPWTRYRTLRDLLHGPATDPQVITAKNDLVQHPKVQGMIASVTSWGELPLKRHNDAAHPIYKFSTLADFGLKYGGDPLLDEAIDNVLARQSTEGAFLSPIFIPKAFGGTNEDLWAWIICDTPTLLYALLSFGLGGDPRVHQAAEHLINLVDENGWRCVCDPDLGKFRGPGRKDDPCPIANVYALKALSFVATDARQYDASIDKELVHLATRKGIEMLLLHWEQQTERKLYLFGIGTDFRKLKYPFVWYNILHVVDVLSRFPEVHTDPRFLEMVTTITQQADGRGSYTANSMYLAWKGWSFANKKEPSPWLTFLVLRILQRTGHLQIP